MSDIPQVARLRQEHNLGIGLTGSLSQQVQALALSSPAGDSPAECRKTLDELRASLLLHFRVEEEGLYPDVQRIAAEGAPRVDILTAFFGEESDDDLKAHALLRARLEEIGGMLSRAQAAGMSDELVGRLANAANLAHDLLSRHAAKEDTLIFPLVERLLDAAQRAAVEAKMQSLRQSARGEGLG